MTEARSVDIVYGDYSFAASGLATPSVSLSTNLSATPGGALLGGTLDITLEGQIYATGILNDINNYDNTSDYAAWAGLTDTMIGLEKAFSKDYEKLMITCGVTPEQETIRPNPNSIWDFYQIDPVSTKINSIEFGNQSDEYWNQVVDYTIALQVEITGATDYISKGGPYFVTDIENSYNITPITDKKFYQAIGKGDQFVDNRNGQQVDSYSTTSVGHLFPFATGDAFPAYTVTRNLSARGRATEPKYDNHASTAVANAKHFVTGVLAYDTKLFEVLDNLYVVNRSAVIDTSEADGTYSITDTFTVYSGQEPRSYVDTFDVNSTTDENFNRTVTINGTIQGYPDYRLDSDNMYWNLNDTESRDQNQFFFPLTKEPAVANTDDSPYMKASGRLEEMVAGDLFYYRCLSVAFPSGFHHTPSNGNEHVALSQSGYQRGLGQRGASDDTFVSWTGWLNPNPIDASYTHNLENGTIDYTVSFDSRPMSLINGAFQENLEVEDNYAVRDYMEQTILKGPPVMSDNGTYSLPARTVSYSASFAPVSLTSSIREGSAYLPTKTIGYIYNALNQFNPNRLNPRSVSPDFQAQYYYYSWISAEDESFDPITGQYSKSVTWNYELRYASWMETVRIPKTNFVNLGTNLQGVRVLNNQFELKSKQPVSYN